MEKQFEIVKAVESIFFDFIKNPKREWPDLAMLKDATVESWHETKPLPHQKSWVPEPGMVGILKGSFEHNKEMNLTLWLTAHNRFIHILAESCKEINA